jgi:hypothetical protein
MNIAHNSPYHLRMFGRLSLGMRCRHVECSLVH